MNTLPRCLLVKKNCLIRTGHPVNLLVKKVQVRGEIPHKAKETMLRDKTHKNDDEKKNKKNVRDECSTSGAHNGNKKSAKIAFQMFVKSKNWAIKSILEKKNEISKKIMSYKNHLHQNSTVEVFQNYNFRLRKVKFITNG